MSMITLLDTKNLVKDSIDSICKMSEIYSDNADTVKERIKALKNSANVDIAKELKNIFTLQGSLIYTYYNKNTVEKVGHSAQHIHELGIHRALEYYYQHQFLHDTAAILDEIFEQKDAEIKFKNAEDAAKKYKAFLLFIEEGIDVLHFAVEYGWLFAEHKVCYEDTRDDADNRTVAFPEKIYEDDNFKNAVIEQVNTWIDEAFKNYRQEDCRDFVDFNLSKDNITPDALTADTETRQVRTLIRNFAFKDWKVYPENYYDGDKLDKLFFMNLDLIKNIYLRIIYFCHENKFFADKYFDDVFIGKDREFKFANEDLHLDNTVFAHLIYGCYVAKNWVNAQRQREDPRYGKVQFGNIIGVRV